MSGGRSYADRVARAQIVLGVITVAVGLVGLFLARDLDFADTAGVLIGWGDLELKFMAYNPLGAAVTIAVGALGVAAGVSRRAVIAWAVSVLGAAMALQVVLQWRPDGDNVLAASGRNLGFALFICIGFAATALLARVAPTIDDADPPTGTA